jgi:hypothetical protein
MAVARRICSCRKAGVCAVNGPAMQASRTHGIRSPKITGICRAAPSPTPRYRRTSDACSPLVCRLCLFGLFCLRPCCIALAACMPFSARDSIGSGHCPAACGEPRACIFPDIYKLALQRTREQRPATLGDMQRIARPIGRSIALRPKSAERIARVEYNRRIRVNSP